MTSWSNSAISTALQCAYKYKLMYVDKIKSETENTDFAFGTAIHLALNQILSGGEGNDIFQMYWNTYKNKELSNTRFSWEKLYELGNEFLRKFKKMHAKKYEPIVMEKRMYGVYEAIKFEGTPDYIGKYEGRLSLRDFKTSAYNYPIDKSLVAVQLYLYAYLMKQEMGQYPETLGYDVFCKSKGTIQTMTWDFEEGQMTKLLDSLVYFCKVLDRDAHYVKNPYACIIGSGRCEMFDVCWKGKNGTS